MLLFRDRVNLGAMAMMGYSALPKAPALLKRYQQNVLCHTQNTRWGSLIPQQRYYKSILQPQPTKRVIFEQTPPYLSRMLGSPYIYIYIYIYIYACVCRIIDTMSKMNTVTRMQNLDKTVCISHSAKIIGKVMNQVILPPAMGK